MNVLLVDDRPLFLDGLKNLLTSHGVHVVGCARDGLEALDKARAAPRGDPAGHPHAAARRAGGAAPD